MYAFMWHYNFEHIWGSGFTSKIATMPDNGSSTTGVYVSDSDTLFKTLSYTYSPYSSSQVSCKPAQLQRCFSVNQMKENASNRRKAAENSQTVKYLTVAWNSMQKIFVCVWVFFFFNDWPWKYFHFLKPLKFQSYSFRLSWFVLERVNLLHTFSSKGHSLLCTTQNTMAFGWIGVPYSGQIVSCETNVVVL